MTLVGELLTDLRSLIRQEIALARAELREELLQVVIAVGLLAVAAGVLGIAGLWLLIAVTHGAAAAFGWPLYSVYAGIGLFLVVCGIIAFALGWHRLRTLQILPQTKETLREHAPWPTHDAEQTA
jgi:hypothetical protein